MGGMRKLWLLYMMCLLYFLIRYFTVQHNGRPDQPITIVENVPVDCEPVFKGGASAKVKRWGFPYQFIEYELFNAEDICDVLPKYFHFERRPLSIEEAEYPLAYGLVTYKDVVQVLLELSIFYYPQNQYCITIDEAASLEFKSAMMSLPRCFNNVAAFVGTSSGWGSFGILENVYNCFQYLTLLDKKWEYYQYLAGSDLPLRTNLEMVRVLKALNGSINSDIDEYEVDRYKFMEGIPPPVPLYKSSMSVAVPRAAANYMVKSSNVSELLNYLSKTWIPDESFWTSVAGSPHLLPVPGSFRAQDIIWLRKHFVQSPPQENSVTSIGTTYIGRYQVWSWQKPCGGKVTSWSCVYGIDDMPTVVKRPELVAHKMYLDFETAAYMCLLKEIRHRGYHPVDFDAASYSEMPSVELHSGKSITELSHPEWLLRSSFYHP